MDNEGDSSDFIGKYWAEIMLAGLAGYFYRNADGYAGALGLLLVIGWHLHGFVQAFQSGLAAYALFCLVMAPLSLLALRPLKALIMLGLAFGLLNWCMLQEGHPDEIMFPAFVYTFLHYAWVTTKIVLKVALAIIALVVGIILVCDSEPVCAKPVVPAPRKLTRRQREFIARYSDH